MPLPKESLVAVADLVPRLEVLLAPWDPASAGGIEDQVQRLLASHEERFRPADALASTRSLVLAAGGLVWRGLPAERRLAIIHRNRYDDWSLPKGKLKPGEPLAVAAQREVQEETGCQPVLKSFAGLLHYLAKSRPKLVFFWHMEAADAGTFTPSEEVDQMDWVTVPEALRRLSYDIERDLLERAVASGRDTARC